jgi:hypothetical protein
MALKAPFFGFSALLATLVWRWRTVSAGARRRRLPDFALLSLSATITPLPTLDVNIFGTKKAYYLQAVTSQA